MIFFLFKDVFTEETLSEHEHQVATVNNFYEENKEMFKLVEKRETLWNKKIDFEVRLIQTNLKSSTLELSKLDTLQRFNALYKISRFS